MTIKFRYLHTKEELLVKLVRQHQRILIKRQSISQEVAILIFVPLDEQLFQSNLI